ncbi:hypothetical protein N7457_001139 [Penicillium paradoxum]|uniref:uncharacterized protein n=1 Tax=Penicillium paradoxum TaxID=176176 RepID=UPI0025467B89|nr:uncharacterized protein N7457_001139 [Penicillium paradoxum]KAJ5794540.1 hypothetical protein N7457_001139 [Penicillium paradoxum]
MLAVSLSKNPHSTGTGCVVGWFRRLQGWQIEDIIDEYRQVAGAKARHWDERIIGDYEPGELWNKAQETHVAYNQLQLREHGLEEYRFRFPFIDMN